MLTIYNHRRYRPLHRLTDLFAWDTEWLMAPRQTISLVDRGDTIEAVTELAGVDPMDVEVDAADGYLEIRAKRDGCTISRSVAVPYEVDLDGATAKLERGVLRVTLAKSAKARPRRIPVH